MNKKKAQMKDWKKELTNCIQSAEELARYLPLTEKEKNILSHIIEKYPMAITPYYLSLIDKDDPKDPIRRMCVPTLDESLFGGVDDTSGEADNTILPGLQHKYTQTALILSTNQCAMYCRHCFRKRMVGTDTDEIMRHFPEILGYISEHPEITNVLISGGDAFLNSTRALERYLEGLSRIEHLDFIRFGTRTPVVFPERISGDDELLNLLAVISQKKQLYVVTQFNHVKELTDQAIEAIHALLRCGVVVKNQTVLLRGVNDTPEALGALLKKLTACGVVPYYIFQCRPAAGVKNLFQVPLLEGYAIVQHAKAMQNGQGKCIKYCMSHPRGKIEILGMMNDEMLFQFHQAKDPAELGNLFTVRLRETQGWLDENLS
ncbi:MAG: KamA family radical SAM protein [Sphaerochaetaceae bacterium]|nr:KamA family radical SAM protein [Sphaerochaetaceae bacterium]